MIKIIERYDIDSIFKKIEILLNYHNINKDQISYNPSNTLRKKLKVNLDNKLVSIRRIVIFYYLGVTCNISGINGTHFVLWEDCGGGLHLDLSYSENNDKFLTIDHIIPVCKSNNNKLDNLQVLTFELNQKKAAN